MIDFINTILLLIVVIGLGAFSRYKNIFKAESITTMSAFVFYIALPALFLSKVSKLEFSISELEIVLGSLVPVIILVALITFAHVFKFLDLKSFVASGVSNVFASNAFFGIAYFSSLYGDSGESFSVISASVMGMVGVVGNAAIFEYGINKRISFRVILSVLKNPAVGAIIAGLLMAHFNISIDFIDKAGAFLGKTAGGLAIFTLGMFIYDSFSFDLVKKSFLYVLFRSTSLPIITYIVLLFLPELSNELKSYLLQQSGIPTAISVAIFSQKYNYMKDRIGGIVVLSSLFSLVILSVLYFISQMIWGV